MFNITDGEFIYWAKYWGEDNLFKYLEELRVLSVELRKCFQEESTALIFLKKLEVLPDTEKLKIFFIWRQVDNDISSFAWKRNILSIIIAVKNVSMLLEYLGIKRPKLPEFIENQEVREEYLIKLQK